MNVEELRESLINKSDYLALKKELDELKESEQEAVYAIVQELIEAFELDDQRVMAMFTGKKMRKKVKPKYRHKETGKTWTGRGRKPADFNLEDWEEIS